MDQDNMGEEQTLQYDLFISYRWVNPDQQWVRAEFAPALRNAGLRVCLDIEDFIPGRDVILEMERTVQQSARVVCVISPDYLDNNRMFEFESMMAIRSDSSGRRSSFIPFILRPTELPVRIRGLIPVDWTVKDLHGREWRKLLITLGAGNLNAPQPAALDDFINAQEQSKYEDEEQITKRKTLVFLCYRRDDSAGHAGRLFDRLSEHFGEGQIFMDIDTIEPGLDFVEEIEQAVGSCEILIALIGKRWLTSTDVFGQRSLDNPEDFIRLEITAALNRKIRTIPVLVHGASMPASKDLPDVLKSLARRNAFELSDARWNHDVRRLIDLLEGVFKSQK